MDGSQQHSARAGTCAWTGMLLEAVYACYLDQPISPSLAYAEAAQSFPGSLHANSSRYGWGSGL